MSGNFWGHGQRDGATRVVRQLSRGTFLRVIVVSRTPSGRLLLLEDWVTEMPGVILPITGGPARVPAIGYRLDGRRLIREAVAILDVSFMRRLSGPTAAGLVRELVDVAASTRQESSAIAVGLRLHLLPVPTARTPSENGSRRRALLALARNGHAPSPAIPPIR